MNKTCYILTLEDAFDLLRQVGEATESGIIFHAIEKIEKRIEELEIKLERIEEKKKLLSPKKTVASKKTKR